MRLPYLTADIPGTGGSIKTAPEDFRVEELPSYEPCGSGDHLYVVIEKQGMTTLDAIRRFAAALKVPEREIGYAGLKDAVGVTRQTISLPRVPVQSVLDLKLEHINVINAQYHKNKLKVGHLKGNRFRITVRGVVPGAADIARAVLDRLQRRGVPNYFGPQRYGAQHNSHSIGRAMLRGDWRGAVDALLGDPDQVTDEAWRNAIAAYHRGDLAGALRLLPRYCRGERDVLQRLVARPDAPEKAFAAIHPRLRKLYLSAWQSHLFDGVVAARLEEIDTIRPGDLAWIHRNGACFLVEDAAVEASRAATFEISASGPMYGPRMKQPAGRVFELEQHVLSDETGGMTGAGMVSALLPDGERRPLRIPLGDVQVHMEEDALQLEFPLPRGSYATSVLREITRSW